MDKEYIKAFITVGDSNRLKDKLHIDITKP